MSARTRDVARLRELVTRELGLYVDDARLNALGELLVKRARASDMDVGAYLDRLDSRASGAELRALATALTINETYFFRHADQLRAFAEVVLPDRMAARGDHHHLRILSAGCATGEEAYTLAILARERLAGTDWKVQIRGVDVDPEVVARAERGRYTAWALRDTAPEIQQRWFRREGKDFVLDPSIRDAVRFEVGNLVRDDPGTWRAGSYDVIFCRNVLMYFSNEKAREAVARMHASLAPGGYFFLGHAETMRGLSQDFTLRHTHDAFYYQRDGAEAGALPWREDRGARTAAGADERDDSDVRRGRAPSIDPSETWLETIQRSSDRIRVLSTDRQPVAVASRLSPPPVDLEPALELLRAERFADALAALDALPPAVAGHLDGLLLRAALLTHAGRFADAEAACQAVLQRDTMSAGAHHLLALCSDGTRDREGAVEHDQIAAYLDPSFAMPRVHLGLMARRAGDGEAARRELGQAVVLLEREDAGRVLLYGGGFTREALIKLCGGPGAGGGA